MGKLFKNIDSMSPELRQNLISEQAQTRLNSLRKLYENMPTRMNPSGTARTLDKMWNEASSNAVGMVGAAMSHSGPMGYVMGLLSHNLAKETPAAVRLGFLKFLASEEATNAGAFKTMVGVAKNMLKGDAAVEKAAKAVFEGGSINIKEADISKLKKTVDNLAAEQERLLHGDNNLAHYMPDHAVSAAVTTSAALNYLAALKPKTTPLSPLDGKLVASKSDEAKYNNALQIAEQPLIVIKKIQNGTITSEDIKHLQNIYPSLYSNIQNKMNAQLVNFANKDKTIPYATKMSISRFIGTPLETSLTQQAIVAAQPQQAQPQGQQAPMQRTRVSADLKKLPAAEATPQQSRAMQRNAK